MTATAKNAPSFKKAVADKTGRTQSDVADVLSRYAIEAAASTPAAKPLRVVKIAFSGVKKLPDQEVPFDFVWDVDGDGVWGILAEGNLVGKSSILQVMLWALRGRTKSLTETVRNWIKLVNVHFRVDERLLKVEFSTIDGEPQGTVFLGNSPETTTERQFSGTEEFAEVMQEIMLAALGLDPIPASQQAAGRILAYDDGWAAYTGAMLTDADSDAIIGEHVGNDLVQRLLQVYIGLPWVKTLFQARRQARILEQDSASRRRKFHGLGGKSLEDLEFDQAEIARRLTDESSRDTAAQQLIEARTERDQLTKKVQILNTDLFDAETTAVASKQSRIAAQKAVHALAEETAASSFFGLLKPHSCPRCSAQIEASRFEKEEASHECYVCTEPLKPSDPNAILAEKELAQAHLKGAKKVESDAERFLKRVRKELEDARLKLNEVGQKLNSLAASGTAADTALLQSENDRLEGTISAVRALIEAEDDSSDDLAIVRAALEEAEKRVKESSVAVMEEVSREVTRLSKSLGMRDVVSVTLKRNAHVEVMKGGSRSKWKDLSPGERLRLRIATVIALSRGAKSLGMGRHPGLFLIDSPGREEVQPEDLRETISELVKLATEYPDNQMFIAMTGTPTDLPMVNQAHIRFAKKGEPLW